MAKSQALIAAEARIAALVSQLSGHDALVASLKAQVASLEKCVSTLSAENNALLAIEVDDAAFSNMHDELLCAQETIASLRAELAKRPPARTQREARPAYVAPPPSAEQLARRAAMAAAKAQAIAEGRSIVVRY